MTAKLERALASKSLVSLEKCLRQGDPTLFVSAILLSAKQGNVQALSWLLDQEIEGRSEDYVARTEEEDTTLHLSATSGNADILQLYIAHCPFVLDWANDKGQTALHLAAKEGHVEIAKILLDLGADYNLADDEGDSPLHYAAAWGHEPIVRLLIERHAAYQMKNNRGYTASDYVFSHTILTALQDSVRVAFENNKREKRKHAAKQSNRTPKASTAPEDLPLQPSTQPTQSRASPTKQMQQSAQPTQSRASRTKQMQSPADLAELAGLGLLNSPPPRSLSLPSFQGLTQNSTSETRPSCESASSSKTSVQQALEKDAAAMERYRTRPHRSESHDSARTASEPYSPSPSSPALPAPIEYAQYLRPRAGSNLTS